MLSTLSEVGNMTFPIVSGVVSGIISSGLFYWYLTKLRPKLFICDYICRGKDESGRFFGFKVYNESSKHDILDLRMEVFIKSPFNAHGGQSYNISPINLKKGHVMVVPKFRKNSTSGDYALILTTRDDLDVMWTKEAQTLEIHIHAKNSFSGASRTFVKKFYQKRTAVKDGMFTFGKTNEVN